eukprot:Sspe_Gene.88524::Locus_60517_Transcript_1_1_Confidence_1.000_Length_740::g.88524::m.88524
MHSPSHRALGVPWSGILSPSRGASSYPPSPRSVPAHHQHQLSVAPRDMRISSPPLSPPVSAVPAPVASAPVLAAIPAPLPPHPATPKGLLVSPPLPTVAEGSAESREPVKEHLPTPRETIMPIGSMLASPARDPPLNISPPSDSIVNDTSDRGKEVTSEETEEVKLPARVDVNGKVMALESSVLQLADTVKGLQQSLGSLAKESGTHPVAATPSKPIHPHDKGGEE